MQNNGTHIILEKRHMRGGKKGGRKAGEQGKGCVGGVKMQIPYFCSYSGLLGSNTCRFHVNFISIFFKFQNSLLQKRTVGREDVQLLIIYSTCLKRGPAFEYKTLHTNSKWQILRWEYSCPAGFYI